MSKRTLYFFGPSKSNYTAQLTWTTAVVVEMQQTIQTLKTSESFLEFLA